VKKPIVGNWCQYPLTHKRNSHVIRLLGKIRG
jgi:hypothetical protein